MENSVSDVRRLISEQYMFVVEDYLRKHENSCIDVEFCNTSERLEVALNFDIKGKRSSIATYYKYSLFNDEYYKKELYSLSEQIVSAIDKAFLEDEQH